MTFSAPTHGLQLRTLIKPSGELELTLATVETPTPGADEVLIRIEATPINPSDIGLLFGAADMSAARFGGTAAAPVVTAPVPERAMKAMAGRLGQSLPAGNEGAGTVVAAGASEAAQALLGKKVSVIAGAIRRISSPSTTRSGMRAPNSNAGRRRCWRIRTRRRCTKSRRRSS